MVGSIVWLFVVGFWVSVVGLSVCRLYPLPANLLATPRIRPRRRFSLDFKRARVRDLESGTCLVSQMGRLYAIRTTVRYRCSPRFGRQVTTPKPSAWNPA